MVVMVSSKEQLPQRLRRARSENRMTLQEAADRAGVEQTTIWRYEAGQRTPSGPTLRVLSQVYRKPVEWFWQEEDEEINDVDLTPIQMASVAILGTVSAGGLVEAWQDDLGTVEVPSNILREAPRAFALKISGSSLVSDWIYDGDVVVVDPDAPFVDGKIYAVRSEENHQMIAARKVYAAGRRVYKLVSGDGEVTEVQRARTTLLGRIRWSFREHYGLSETPFIRSLLGPRR